MHDITRYFINLFFIFVFWLKAFRKAWKKACQSGGTVAVNDGTYLVKTIQFAGPCKGRVSFMVNAVVQAPPGKSNVDYWISFYDINGLIIHGNGTFDGQGPSAWRFKSCNNAASCRPLSPVSSEKYCFRLRSIFIILLYPF